MTQTQVNVPPGILAIPTFGHLTAPSVTSLLATERRIAALGLDIDVQIVSGLLVDKCRNEVGRMLLDSGRAWALQIDADMQFDATVLDRLLTTAFQTHPHAAVVGGYCNLKGSPYLPTIDTGTGTWEVQHAGQGVIPVIRTGGACLLVKRVVFETLAYPWFGVRTAPRPLDALAEVDGFARQLYDGRNPLEGAAWRKLTDIAAHRAAQERSAQPSARDDLRQSSVGEDSAFCDAVRAAGFEIVVDTNAVCYHLETRPIGPQHHLDAIAESREVMALAVGVTGL